MNKTITTSQQTNILSFNSNPNKRFYKTCFENHDSNIIGMFCLRSNELLSVDTAGGLKRLNIDTLISETLDLFGDGKIVVTCVSANEEGNSLYFGLESGAIWTSDLNTSDELIYSHSSTVTAITSAKATVFSAGKDLLIKMFNLKSQSLVATINCTIDVNILQPLSNIFGSPLIVADINGCVSIWSPHLLKKSNDSVQFCCNMKSKILSISQLTLFDRTCIVCTTSTTIHIYSITYYNTNNNKECISILKDNIYSLVRVINLPDGIEFTSCCSMNSIDNNTSFNNINLNINSMLLTSCSDGYVYQWETISGNIIRKYQITNNSIPCISLIYLPIYQMFATIDQLNSLYLINYSSTPLVDIIPITLINSNNNTSNNNNNNSKINLNTYSNSTSTPISIPTNITCVSIIDNHSIMIAYGDSNGQIYLQSNITNQTKTKNSSNLSSVTSIAIVILELSDECIIISGHLNGLLQFFICQIDGTMPQLENAKSNQINSIYQSKITTIQNISNERIATASELESIIIWKLNSNGMVKLIQLQDSLQIHTLIHHPDGYLIGHNTSNELNLWNIHDNWKKIITSSHSQYSHDNNVNRLGLMFDKKKNIHYLLTTTHNYDKIKFWKIQGNKLLLDGMMELPQQCSNIMFWNNGESNWIILQSSINGLIYTMNLQSYNQTSFNSRYFISSSSSSYNTSLTTFNILNVTGNTSPIIVTTEINSYDNSTSLMIWNNDLFDMDQFYYQSLNIALEQYTTSLLDHQTTFSTIITENYLWNLIESHPSFPYNLLIPNIKVNKYENLFTFALMNGYPQLLIKYLPKIPIAVTQSSYYFNKKRSLLYLALKLKNMIIVDLILSQWIRLISDSQNSTINDKEYFQYHIMELFSDIKILSREQPAKYSQFIQQLDLQPNHEIIQKNCYTKMMSSYDDMWMRGTEFRLIPSFWELFDEKSKLYPDLMARSLEPEDEILWLQFEQPQKCITMQQIYTTNIENNNNNNSNNINNAKSNNNNNNNNISSNQILNKQNSNNIQINIEDDDNDPNQYLQNYSTTGIHNHNVNITNNSIALKETKEGILVQAYVHPIPYAAAGVEFLKICQRTYLLTGQKTLLSCPLVTSVIDYKWNTIYSSSYHSQVLHSLFSLILYSFLCVYFEELIFTPTKTGLPYLVWIVSICLIWNYFLLFIQLLLRLIIENYKITFQDPWFYIGLFSYITSISGISMSLYCSKNNEIYDNKTSFNSRCTLAAGCILLYLQFLYLLLPLQSIGLFIQRLFLTIQSVYYNYLLILFCIVSFSVSFNLFHHRHKYDDDLTYDSFYGSFLQSFIYVFGGYNSIDLFDTADSPLIMSIYFPIFIIIILWILIIYLITSTNEVYNETESQAISLWRLHQNRIILYKSSLLSELISSHPFHNPKWLQILKPVNQNAILSNQLNENELNNNLCSCSNSVDNEAKESIEDIRRDMDLLKNLFYQLNDQMSNILASQTLKSNNLSPRDDKKLLDQLTDIIKDHCYCRKEGLKVPEILPPIEPSESIVVLSPRDGEIVKSFAKPPPLSERALSKTDNEMIRPPNDTTPKNDIKKGKGDTGIRVRQIKSSKKKLSSKISGMDLDEEK